MDVLLGIDMQMGLLDGAPKHDLAGVIDRLNRVAAMVRGGAGQVIWIQHEGAAGDSFSRGAPGWSLLPELDRQSGDLVVAKTLNDAFAGTELSAVLARRAPQRLLVAGWATDFCVDSTVRSAVSHGHAVTIVADGHTLADRPHLSAPDVIRHHNWIWSGLIAQQSPRIVETAALLAGR